MGRIITKKKLLEWIDEQLHAYNSEDMKWRRRRGVWWDGKCTGVIEILKEIKKIYYSRGRD